MLTEVLLGVGVYCEARSACKRHLNDLFMLGKNLEQGLALVGPKLQTLPAWSRRHVRMRQSGHRAQKVSCQASLCLQ